MVLVTAANASPVAGRIQFNDLKIWGIAALCILLSAIGFLLTRFIASVIRCNPEKKVTLLFSGGMRNISAVIIVAVSFFPEVTVLPALLGILFQQSTVAPLMGRLFARKGSES
jgi:predicted Na+-dependent transporter